MIRRLAIVCSGFALVAAFAFGCTPDTDRAGPGQDCVTDADCAPQLVCQERQCVSDSDPGEDAGLGDVADEDTGVNDTENQNDNDVDPGDDCTPGDSRCDSDETVERCVTHGDQDPYWTASSCADDHVCEDGICVDESGDPSDDECCPDGCGDGEVCNNCECVEYDPDECTYQDQPCSNQSQISNGFVCAPTGADQLRCRGLCDPGADNPDETCPEAGTICQFEDTDQANGHCLQSCSIGDPCADDWMTCVYNDAAFEDGVCHPQTDTKEIGEACDPDDIFGCKGNAACIGGFCRQACRPFDHDETDCDEGYCIPFDEHWGICADDSTLDNGECSAPFTTCGADATGCFDDTPNQPRSTDYVCRDYCRLVLDDEDCPDGQVCDQHDPNNDAVGACYADDE